METKKQQFLIIYEVFHKETKKIYKKYKLANSVADATQWHLGYNSAMKDREILHYEIHTLSEVFNWENQKKG